MVRWRLDASRPWLVVVVCALAAVTLRLPFMTNPLGVDEAGYLIVARHWGQTGPFLFGELWVDRPPLLIGLFFLADHVGDDLAVRVLGMLAAVVLVLAAGRVGWLTGGDRGAYLSAVVAAGLVTTPLLDTQHTNGELLAVPFVMLCVLFALEARRRAATSGRTACLVVAGGCGSAAVLVKQNMVDGLVFVFALIAATATMQVWSWTAARRAMLWTMLGVALPLLAGLTWAASTGLGVDRLWFVLYGFRIESALVIAGQSMDAPFRRLLLLLLFSVLSGIVPLLWMFLRRPRNQLGDAAPLRVALLAMAGVGGLGVLLGGSYWRHYLIELIPVLATATGFLVGTTGGIRPPRWPVALVATSTVVATVCVGVVQVVGGAPHQAAEGTGKWLAESAEPDDTAVVLYGHANVLEAAGLRSPYPYLWSLPARTLDPELASLRATLQGPAAPTWVVAWGALNSWDIDREGRLRGALRSNYERVAVVCGRRVFLREDLWRPLAPVPDDCQEYAALPESRPRPSVKIGP